MIATRVPTLIALVSLGAVTTACDTHPSDADDAGVTLVLDADVDAYAPPGSDGGVVPTTDGSAGDDAGAGGDAGGVGPTGELVDPTCTDGMFTEPLPDWNASIGDLVAAYTSAEADTFALGVLDRRYPTGAVLVRGGGECISHFLRDTRSAGAVLGQLDVIVHECGHFYDLTMSGSYQLNETLRLTPAGASTFARNRIVSDEFQPDRAPCDGGFIGCDRYADTYLADDASGNQGFHMLFEEAVQYVHSLATGLTITNELGASSRSMSHRDGLLTFLWYVERYLRMARLDYPDVYALLLDGDGGSWREAILTLWGQAWLYLEVTSDMAHLGIEDDVIERLVLEPVLLEEIQRLRDASGC